MIIIKLGTAMTLTAWSTRSLWRRISEGTFARSKSPVAGSKVKLLLEDILPHACIPLTASDLAVVQLADAGDPDAQNDLALLFLGFGKHKSALYWLQLAAKQHHHDAMFWLGYCCIQGLGGQPSADGGLMWIAKAAAHGHLIAQAQMQSIRSACTSPAPSIANA